MKRVILIITLVIVAIAAWLWLKKGDGGKQEKKQDPIKSNIVSTAANKSIEVMVASYINLKNSFVEWDTTAVKTNTKTFIATVDSLKLDELKKDTSKDASSIVMTAQTQAGDLKSNAVAIMGEKDITEMRKDFKMVSENLYDFIRSVKSAGYSGQRLYWQNCPMAFGEDKDASWISNTEEINNPYLGKHHPEFKAGMLHCGEVKDSL